jgi:two-component system OmpR family sensor kinase
MISLRRRLLTWLLAMLVATAIVSGSYSYFLAYEDANELLDRQLRQISHAVSEQTPLSSAPKPRLSDEPEERFFVQVWDRNGAMVRKSEPGIDLPRHTVTGFTDVSVPGGDWRVYALVMPEHTVQVSQLHLTRREIASESALHALTPIFFLIPLCVFLVRGIVGQSTKTLQEVASAAGERDERNPLPLPVERIPVEVVPLVEAMNSLLDRMHRALDQQRRFDSDAAHAMRTPLTALRLQIENLRLGPARGDWLARLTQLDRAVQHASRVVDQLLQLSRQGAAAQWRLEAPVVLNDLLRDCITDLAPLADDKGIDLGIVRDDPARIRGIPAELGVLFDNLLDNALRYTPAGGMVDVAITATATMVTVEIIDTGPGIVPPLSRVFEPFVRAVKSDSEGSGLGLAIAKEIAERHGARIELENRTDHAGLIARVIFPRGEAMPN